MRPDPFTAVSANAPNGRPASVHISLSDATGAGLTPASVVFMGWFGPRGLASIVLGPVYLEFPFLPFQSFDTLEVNLLILSAVCGGIVRPRWPSRSFLPVEVLVLAESHLTRRLFGGMLNRIVTLPMPAG